MASHLCSLVLKPDLDHTHTEACLCGQRLSDLPGEGETGQAPREGAQQLGGGGFGGIDGWVGRWREVPIPSRSGRGGVWKGSGGGSATAPFRPPLTFRQGLEETSKEALKALRCCVVRMVRGRLGLRGSFPSSPLPLLWLPCPLAGFMSPSSSSLFTVGDTTQPVSLCPKAICCPMRSISPTPAGQHLLRPATGTLETPAQNADLRGHQFPLF